MRENEGSQNDVSITFSCDKNAKHSGTAAGMFFRDHISQSQGYQPGYQPEESGVIKLNANENPYPPSPTLIDVLSGITLDHLRKYPDSKANEFRNAASRIDGVEPENILCCKGGDEFLSMAIRSFCDQDRPLAFPGPTYSLYRVLANFQNCKSIEIPYDKNGAIPKQLENTGAALTIVCNPNAPTGTRVEIEQLASLAHKIRGILLIDEAYVDFTTCNAVKLIDDYDNVIILRSLSKGYSLAGLRFGYAIACKPLIDELMKIKESYNVDALSIALAAAAIRDRSHFESNISKIVLERQTLTDNLRVIGFEVPNSHTNFVLAKPNNMTAPELCRKLEIKGIYVRNFDLPGLADKIRISIGTPQQHRRLIEAIKEIQQSI